MKVTLESNLYRVIFISMGLPVKLSYVLAFKLMALSYTTYSPYVRTLYIRTSDESTRIPHNIFRTILRIWREVQKQISRISYLSAILRLFNNYCLLGESFKKLPSLSDELRVRGNPIISGSTTYLKVYHIHVSIRKYYKIPGIVSKCDCNENWYTFVLS